MKRTDDAYMRVTLPSGVSFAVRESHSGIVFDGGRPVDEELAADMLYVKLWKLQQATAAGRC